MNAADVLADAATAWNDGAGLEITCPEYEAAALLAHGEQGQHRGGIYIDLDGEMWRANLFGTDVLGHSLVVLLPILVPLSAEAEELARRTALVKRVVAEVSAEAGDTDG